MNMNQTIMKVCLKVYIEPSNGVLKVCKNINPQLLHWFNCEIKNCKPINVWLRNHTYDIYILSQVNGVFKSVQKYKSAVATLI